MSTPRPAWAKDSVLLRFDERRDPRDLELTSEWAFDGATGEGVRVAIVDSGVEASHPLLEGCVDEADGVMVTVDNDGSVVFEQGPHPDVFGHGTACAGIIHSLAPKARITSVRVLGPNLTGKAAAFHAGLQWAVDQGFHVINLSLGTTKKDWALAFHEVCDQAYFSNSFLVTAANNVARTSYPSLYAAVASVACNTSSDSRRYHANPEPPTEFLARGIDVEVAWLNGTTNRSTGNSYAAPHIAGFAALLRSKHPELRPFQVKAALWATAANVAEAGDGAVGPVEAAGRASMLRSTSMRSTSLRATSMRPSTMHPSTVRPSTMTAGATTAPSESPARATLAPTATTAAPADPAVAAAWAPLLELTHPHLLPLRGGAAGPEPVRPGRPLRSILDGSSEDGPLPTTAWRTALAVAAAAGVAALHRHGMVHGDLRPTDLTLDGAGLVRVGGMERRLAGSGDARAGRAMSVADLRYLAAEQLRDEPVVPPTDVHALGLVLCELLAGRLPYPDVERVGDLLRQRLATAPDQVAALGVGIAAPIAAVLQEALAPEVAARPADAGALARRLAAAAVTVIGRDRLVHVGPLDEGVLADLLDDHPTS